MMNKTLIGIDPGETVGIAIVEASTHNRQVVVEVMESLDEPTDSIEQFSFKLYGLLKTTRPAEIVVEDYRVYLDKAQLHVGRRLYTAEMIGAIRAVCTLFVPTIPVVVYPANVKGSWPKAKLDKYIPYHTEVTGHAHDALVLVLHHLHRDLGEGDGTHTTV
jgi:hypothetical protein